MSTRIYQDIPLETGQVLTLDEGASHHLSRVLRLKTGVPMRLFNGQGGEFTAEITHIDRHQVTLKIQTFSPDDRESSLAVHLGQAIIKQDNMNIIIQKTVELGVQTITPLITEHCVMKQSEKRKQKCLSRWRAMVIHACEQCGRTIIPTVNPIMHLSDWLQALPLSLKILLHPYTNGRLSHLVKQTTATLLIGPEGGLTEQEVDLAKQQGFHAIALGSRILRTETATLAALTLLQHQWGDL